MSDPATFWFGYDGMWYLVRVVNDEINLLQVAKEANGKREPGEPVPKTAEHVIDLRANHLRRLLIAADFATGNRPDDAGYEQYMRDLDYRAATVPTI